jgi:signal transduction histidine kinase
MQIQPQSLQLAPLLESVLSQWQWAPIEVDLQIPAELQLRADPYRLQQVLINLLDNAHAFLRNQSAGKLAIRASADHQGWVEIQIHNNGPSLDPQLLNGSLFRPFVSKRPGGSGLGLAIVKRIIDAHQGRIEHRQDLGFNVSFVIMLPPLNIEQRQGEISC